MPPRNPSGDEPEIETLKAHIQGRLHSATQDGGRERDALTFYHKTLKETTPWDDRRIVTESLLALRMYWEKGYRPPDNPQGAVTHEILAVAKEARETLQLAREAMQMLSTLDLTSLRTQPGWKEDVWEKTSIVVSKGAAAMMGHAKSYGDDDDD